MKILYLSCHEILEYDELKMLSEIGHEIYSLGAYTHPGGEESRKRPPLPNLPYDPHFIELATRYNQDNIHPEMLEGIDAVIIMHVPDWIEKNWPTFKEFIQKGGRVIWRSIGQSIPHVERRLKQFRDEGMQIVRYSPKEETIQDYIGSDAMIRFGKDPNEYGEWEGSELEVINFTQSMLQRGQFCGWGTVKDVFKHFPNAKVYGPGNEPLGTLNGGLLSYEDQKKKIRNARAYLYAGTYPASYTLSFIEAWMTGIPIVAVGQRIGNGSDFGSQSTYEIHELITNGKDGFVSDTLQELRQSIQKLLGSESLAQRIGRAGREKAIEIFGIESVKEQWRKFLC